MIFELPLRCRNKSVVQTFLGHVVLQLSSKAEERRNGDRHAKRYARHFSREFREKLVDSLSHSRRRRNYRFGCGTSAAEIFVGTVVQVLIPRHGVNRVYESSLNAEILEHGGNE